MAHFTENWGFYTFLTELPTFLNDVLHYDMYKWVPSIAISIKLPKADGRMLKQENIPVGCVPHACRLYMWWLSLGVISLG